MRKKIFIIALASLYLLACNSNNRKDYTPLDVEVASKMSNNYKKLIDTAIKHVIRQITMDQKQLRKFTAGAERVKLVAAAYDKPINDEEGKPTIYTTVIIQIGTRENDKPVYTYYDFRDVFKPKIKGKEDEDGDNNTICPPPENCTFPPLIKK